MKKLLDRENPSMENHCMCPACKDGVLHKSDCAVHNAPALPIAECNCGAINRRADNPLNHAGQ